MIGSLMIILPFIAMAVYTCYKYWIWASAMDQINEDHFYYLRTSAPIEGIDFVYAKEEDIVDAS